MAVRRSLVAGRYRLHEPVGTGGMGRVWMARDELLDRDVAVKEFIPPEWMTGEERDRLRTRTLREARSAARLNHPHVVRIYDVVHAADLPWIVMEYVDSRSLYQVIADDGPLSPARTAHIGLHVLDGLTAAHRAGVLHRDVKPHNVLIGHDGRVVLTDFGLATFVDDGAVTGPGVVVGSPQYVSPERARDGTSTVESDLWSLGATLYTAVEGRSPYARESAMATLTALATEPPDPPQRAGPLAAVLTGLLRHDPRRRLSADEVQAALRRVATGAAASPGPAPHPPGLRPPRPRVAPDDRPGSGPDRVVAGRAAVPAAARDDRPTTAGGPGGAPPALPTVYGVRPDPPVPAPHAAAASPNPVDDAPPRRSRRRLAVTGVVLVAVLAGGGLIAGRLVDRDDPTGIRGTAGAPPGSTAPSGQAAGVAGFTPTTCANTSGTDLPRTPLPGALRTSPSGYALVDGLSYHRDPSGFLVAVPDGWTYEKIGATLCFRDPAGIRVLSVDTARKPSADPVKACRDEAARLTGAGELPGYEEISIARVQFVTKAADWEYRYDDRQGTRLHANTRWLAAGGRAFAIGWVTREFDWTTSRSYLDMIQASFQTG